MTRDDCKRFLALAQFFAGAVSLAVVVVLATLTALAVVPSLLPGWQSAMVGSGSMMPVLRVGDVVVLQDPGDEIRNTLTAPTVALLDRPSTGVPLVHRIVEQNEKTGAYTTRGDANNSNDPEQTPTDSILGVGRLAVPAVGIPALMIREQRWSELALLGVGLVLLAHMSRWGWGSRYDPWVR